MERSRTYYSPSMKLGLVKTPAKSMNTSTTSALGQSTSSGTAAGGSRTSAGGFQRRASVAGRAAAQRATSPRGMGTTAAGTRRAGSPVAATSSGPATPLSATLTPRGSSFAFPSQTTQANYRGGSTRGDHPPPSALAPTEGASSPARVHRSQLESEHQSELLQRQKIHHKLLSATEGRRDRAFTILEMHRTEIMQTEEIIRHTEAETTTLEGLRRDLAEAMRRQEVVAFKTTKDVQYLKQEQQREQLKLQAKKQQAKGGAGSGLGLMNNAAIATSPWVRAALGSAVQNNPISVTSPLRTLYGTPTPTATASATAASVLLNGSSVASSVKLFPHSAYDPTLSASTTPFDLLTQRLNEARRIADELEAECVLNEKILSDQKKERAAIKDLIFVADSHVRDLERDAPQTLDSLKTAESKIRTATEHAQLLPDLQRMVEDNAVTLHLQRQSSAETTTALMELIKDDDVKLSVLKRVNGGSTSSSAEYVVGGGSGNGSSVSEGATQTRTLAENIHAASASPQRAPTGVTTHNSTFVAALLSSSKGHGATFTVADQFGPAVFTSIVGKIALDLEHENEVYDEKLSTVVRVSEQQRIQLQATADTLASRVRYLEDRLVKVKTA